MENIWIWIVIGIVLWQGMTLLQFFVFLYYKFRPSEYRLIRRDEVNHATWKLIVPYEKHLFEKGFVFKYVAVSKSVIVGSDILIHKFYYYQPEQGVHAFLETTPYKGSVQSIRIAFDTVYESKHICTTENGMAHFISAVPREVYLFDHYLALWEKVYEKHLEDRIIENEIIHKEPFTQEGWFAYMYYSDQSYIDAMVELGIVKRIKEGYKYRPSLALWKFAKKSIWGQREFARILKENAQNRKMDTISKEHHTEGLLAQMNQEDKPRGESSNKMLWLAGSVIAFVVLFGILGFSLIDIGILVTVLFVHELGHYLAMRFFGYTDTSIFFLPFGAVTIGHKQKRKAYEEFIVSLMGPLPGLLIGLGLIVYEIFYYHRFNTESYLGMYAMMSLFINYINLLPIYPLDGGRILQTLLLLRYPKGQFYFYVIGLAVLTAAMVWLRDPILLIFVVLVALGLKQSYKISQLLQKLFKKYKQDEITQEKVASILIEDENFAKETLASKSKIGKQAMLIVETKKPSKLLSIFGLTIYLVLLLPPIVIIAVGLRTIGDSPYKNLSEAGKKELRRFDQKIEAYRTLTLPDDMNYTMEESMKILDEHFSSSTLKRQIGDPLRTITDDSYLPCPISKKHLKVLQWHNGIELLLPYQKLMSDKELITQYRFLQNENKTYGTDSQSDTVLSVSDDESYGLAYSCIQNGLFEYSPYLYDGMHIKKYYGWNHFLKVTAEAYRQGIYKENNGHLSVDRKGLATLQRRYYSSADQKKYSEFVNYLMQRATVYKNSKDMLLKISLLQTIGDTYDTTLQESVRNYLHDNNANVKEKALYVLGKVGDKTILPLLLSYTKSKESAERNMALLSIAKIVNHHNSDLLPSLYPLLNDDDLLVRLSLYEVIGAIKDKGSLNYLHTQFAKETRRGKQAIIDLFGEMGTESELKLLKEYLNEVNKIDMSAEDKGGFRGDDPHPAVLKRHLEDAIGAIERRTTK